jgi:hypothetical protein
MSIAMKRHFELEIDALQNALRGYRKAKTAFANKGKVWIHLNYNWQALT